MGVSVREKQKGSGKFYIYVRHAGERTAFKYDSEDEAEAVATAFRQKIALGELDLTAIREQNSKQEETKVPTLAEYYKRFTRVYLETSVRQGTRDRYATSFDKHILPELGDLPLNEITREKVKDFVAHLVRKRYQRQVKVKTYAVLGKMRNPTRMNTGHRAGWVILGEQTRVHSRECLRVKVKTYAVLGKMRNPTITYKTTEKPLSKTTIRIILSQLTAVFSHAVEEQVITVNPATRLSKFYKQAPVVHEEIEPLTSEEVPVFLSAVIDRPASKQHYPLFLCAIHTGMRAGELIGLQWQDIDFRGKFVAVRRCITRGRIEPTKTGKRRRIDMSDALLNELQALKKRRQEEYLKKGSNEIPEWVFCNREGKPHEYYNLKHRHFEKCLAAARLRRIRFHDLRHTFASLLIQNGESLAYVKDQLGHSSIKMTVDVYGHLVPGANRAAVNKLPTEEAKSSSTRSAESYR